MEREDVGGWTSAASGWEANRPLFTVGSSVARCVCQEFLLLIPCLGHLGSSQV